MSSRPRTSSISSRARPTMTRSRLSSGSTLPQPTPLPVMKTCSKPSKIYLTAMVYELYKTGMGETTFEKLAMTVYNLCTSNGEAFPGHDTLLKVGYLVCLIGLEAPRVLDSSFISSYASSCVDTFHEEKSKRERRKENKALTMELLVVAYSSLVAKMEEIIYRLVMMEFSATQKYSLASNSTYNVEEAGDL